MKRLLPLLVLFLTIGNLKTAFAQSADVNTIQPKIMVIPYVKENEDLRTVLEA